LQLADRLSGRRPEALRKLQLAPRPPLALTAAVNRETLADWCLRGIMGIVIAALVFAPLAFGSVRPQEFQYLVAAAALVLVLWTARLWLLEESRLHWPPAAWAVVAFMGYAVFAYWRADVEYVARGELLRAAVYAVFFLAALNHASGRETPQIITGTLIVLGVGLTVYGVWQFATNSAQVWFLKSAANYGRRATGTYINPNHFAGFLDMVIPLALACTIAGRMGHVTRIVIGYCTFVMLAGLALTQSRGGWVATACGLGVMLFVALWNPRLRLPALAFAIIVAIGGAVFLNHSFAQKRIEEAKILSGDSSKGVRLMIWETAWQAWKTSPWTGIGPGHFDLRFREFRPARLVGRPEYVHNDYLNTLTDWGIAGLALALGFAGCMALHAFQASRGLKSQNADLVANRSERRLTYSNRTAFVLGATGSFVALLVHSIFDFNLQIPANALVFFVLLGTLAGHLRYTTNRHQFRCGVPAKALLTVCLLAIAALGVMGFLRIRQEQRALANANRKYQDPAAWRDAWKAAYDAEPKNALTAQAVGELYRRSAWTGGDDYAEQAVKAMEWFHRAVELNPHDSFSLLRIGMCLHWIGRHQDAAPYFERALKQDPNGYFTVAHLGWHQYQLQNYAEAKRLFEHSLQITPWGVTNETARAYIGIVEQRLKEPPGDYVPKLTPR
jgi:O-antigen ligase